MRSRTAIIVDDHPLARMAIRGVLEKDRVTVLGEYEDGAIALKSLLKTTADIVVIDVEIYFPFFSEEASEILTDAQRLESLSTQEMKVMGHVLNGLDNSQIGEAMHISGKTVSTYKTRLMEKLGCKSLIELLSFAHQNKLT